MSNTVELFENKKIGFGFLEKDEYEKRNLIHGDDSNFRHLEDLEISLLEANGNIADDWDNVLVSDKFYVPSIKNNTFYGKVRIGQITDSVLKFHDLELPAGITNSTIISSDIGDNCAIHNIQYLSNYVIGEKCIIHCVNEMQTTNHSKFGNGIVKKNENQSVRIDLHIMNENGGRAIAPFEDLICADAILWADKRDDSQLNQALWKLTDSSYSTDYGWYGEVGSGSVIKGCRIIKDVKFGESCYVKGCNKLKNLTIKSSKDAPTQLGEGIELVNGIVGFGCHVFYGCKAIRFVMCENSTLKYGARLINSVLGDNSTVSCCEVLSNLVFPFHEQHHNNSFLISSLVMGQSNMAAGANIGSNHNSRSADGEMRAGRGFWPALSSTLKFDSKFASFVIIAKGNYIHELNVRFPFCLLSDNMKLHRREVMPAYWWLYNMYALERNSAKFAKRDNRFYAVQHIETDYLAPDTVSEMLNAVDYLSDLLQKTDNPEEIYATDIEKSHTPVKILKPVRALDAYKTMLEYYGIKTVIEYCATADTRLSVLLDKCEDACMEWTNLGGQLVPSYKVNELKDRIKRGDFSHWNEVHEVYNSWFKEYPYEKALHAMYILKHFVYVNPEIQQFTEKTLETMVQRLVDIRAYIDNQISITREKDYNNNFRLVTYSNTAERDAVLGKFQDNEFVKSSKETTDKLLKLAKKVVW